MTHVNEHRSVLTNRTCLTHDNALKPVMSIDLKLSVRFDFLKKISFDFLSFKEDEFVFEPGDAIKIICANDENEVNLLFKR